MIPTDRLTQKAKEVLQNFEGKNSVPFNTLLEHIGKSMGMGSNIIKLFPDILHSQTKELDVSKLVQEAFYQAMKMESFYVGTEHLLLGALHTAGYSSIDKVREQLVKLNVFPAILEDADKVKKTPLMDSFAQTLVGGEPSVIYKDEYDQIISVLLQKNNSNTLLVGDSGVGKGTLVNALAWNINALNVPPALIGYRVIELDLVSFMTSIMSKGITDNSLVSLVEELNSVGKRVIVSIKNFQNLFFSTNAGFTIPIFYFMFKNSLEEAGIRMIATMPTTLHEKLTLDNEQILDKFTIITVSEPKEPDILKLLNQSARNLGTFHDVDISPTLVNYVYKKAKEYIKDLKFPQKGLDLLDASCALLIMKKSKIPDSYKKLVDKTFTLSQLLEKELISGAYEQAIKTHASLAKKEKRMDVLEDKIFVRRKRLRLTTQDVDHALNTFGVDKAVLREADLESLAQLAKRIKKKIIGQDTAVDAVVKSLIRARLGLRSKKRPLGNFLFLGPTGVGKTEFAKVLAHEFFDSENSLIRLDMSDFSEKHTVARLVGAPPGYVGYGEGGELTEKIQNNPNSVVLFDEIEKAHPDVLNILLQIMEEGELSDAKGATYDFSKAIVILTSNLGSELINAQGVIGFDEQSFSDEKVEDRLKLNLKKILKPELINRFDEVIVFRRLSKPDQEKILELLLTEISETLKKQDISMSIDKKAKRQLLQKGYSEEYGARALRRTVERELLDTIAELILANKKKIKQLIIKGDNIEKIY